MYLTLGELEHSNGSAGNSPTILLNCLYLIEDDTRSLHAREWLTAESLDNTQTKQIDICHARGENMNCL